MIFIVYLLVPVIIIGLILFLLVKLILSSRYESSIAKKIIFGIFILSFIATAVYYKIAVDDSSKNDSNYVIPAIDWQKVETLSESTSGLEYRSGIGLFALADGGEKQLTKVAPYCRIENQLIKTLPENIEITDTPFAEIPAPPHAFKQQIIFDIQYSVEYDAQALSSFAVLDNGEVWCTERVFRGPADFPSVALIGLGIMITAVSIFTGSIITLLLLTLISFEIYRWRKSKIAN